MPTYTRSALNPNGSWQADGMDEAERFGANRADQWNQFNINNGNQRSQDDWRKTVALQQLGLQRDMWAGGREDSAAARTADDARFTKQFDYMGNRDKTLDTRQAAEDALSQQRWQEQFGLQKDQFGLQKTGIEQDREFRNLDLQDRRDERAQAKPLNALQSQVALEQLKQMQQRQTVANNAGISYAPQTPEGRDTYEFALSQTGDPKAAAAAAKQAERAKALENAGAEASTVGSDIGRFSAKDTKMFGADPTAGDQADLVKRVEAVAQLYRSAGYSEQQVTAAVRDMLTKNAGNYRDLNAGNIQSLLARFGIK